MQIFLASDHRGFKLKEQVKSYLLSLNSYLISDVGASSYIPDDDYVDYAQKVFSHTPWLPDYRTILFCGSGHGMDIVANRYSYIRAILAFNFDVVKQGREHEDANVLIIPADWTNEAQAQQQIDLFLNTPFSNAERHVRRLEKIKNLEIRN